METYSSLIKRVRINDSYGRYLTFDFTVDAFPGTLVSDSSKQVLATIQILNADDNYDLTTAEEAEEITYKRYQYNQDGGAYLGIEQLADGSEGPVTKSTAAGDAKENGPAAGIDDPTQWS